VQHGTDRCSRTAEDSRGLFDRNVVHQFDQTLLLTRGPLPITALIRHSEATQETQARVAWVPRNLYQFQKDPLSVATLMVPELFGLLPVVSDELPGPVRPTERAALLASTTAIHTVFVSKERLLQADRSSVSELMALPSRIPLYLYMSVTREFVTGRIWCFWRKFFAKQRPGWTAFLGVPV
jgi:hypothetical protein